MAIFTGAGVAIVTPFREDGSVDYDSLDRLIDFHCENGTDSIVICGTSGEAATLTEEEHMKCVKFTVERTKGRIPVIAGTGSNCTATAMALSEEAAGYGADGVLVVTPYYNKATQKGMITHFTKVAQAAKVPVVLYNIPGRTGCKMEAETVAQLVNHVDNIVAIKEASGDFSNIGYICDDFEYIFNKIKSQNLCFCYDTGHNLINNSDYISNLNDRLEIIHLSDNNGIDDSHLGIGRGILHENEIKKLLSVNAKYLILEINHNHIKETIDILDKIKKGV